MLRAEKRTKNRIGKTLITVGIILLVFALYVDMRVRPLVEKIAEHQCYIAATRIINDVIFTELTGHDYAYESLINVSYSATGEIKSITSDMQSINRLKSRSALLVNEGIASLNAQSINVSMGTASGVSFLYGRGPSIPVRIMPKGHANAVFVSEFSSAGINQTLHRIIMEMEVEITAVIPGFNRNLTVKSDFIIAETVIVGKVPFMYAEISGAGEIFNGEL